MIRLIVIFSMISIFMCNVVPAKIITVDDDGKADFKTIQEGIEAAESGDTVEVKPGRYEENIALDKDNIILQGAGAGRTFIISSKGSVVALSNVRGGRLTGFTIDGVDKGGNVRGIRVSQSHDFTISHNEIRNVTLGIAIGRGSTSIKVIGNRISDGRQGIYIGGGSDDILIKDNEITDQVEDGIYCLGAKDVMIKNNLIKSCARTGIYSVGTTIHVLRNKIRNENLPTNNYGVSSARASAKIEYNQIWVSFEGINVGSSKDGAGESVIIRGNEVESWNTGIRCIGGSPLIRWNILRTGVCGVVIGGNPDLGTKADWGMNSFLRKGRNPEWIGIRNVTPNEIFAIGNYWGMKEDPSGYIENLRGGRGRYKPWLDRQPEQPHYAVNLKGKMLTEWGKIKLRREGNLSIARGYYSEIRKIQFGSHFHDSD